MSDPFDEPAYEPEKEPTRFEQFRASLTSPGKVANEPLDEQQHKLKADHQRTWSEEPIEGGAGVNKQKEDSLFQRFRKSLAGNGEDDEAQMNSPERVNGNNNDKSMSKSTSFAEDDDDGGKYGSSKQHTEASEGSEPVESPTKGGSSGWTFFKTKEQKELVVLEDEEEKERKVVKDDQKAERKALEKEYKVDDEKIRDAVKKYLKTLGELESQEKKAREEIAKELKKEFDTDIKEAFKKELKKLEKK